MIAVIRWTLLGVLLGLLGVACMMGGYYLASVPLFLVGAACEFRAVRLP